MSQVSVRSNLSGASPVTPQNYLPLQTPDNMGLLLTPLCRVMEMRSEEILEEGYDSDMQFGPYSQGLKGTKESAVPQEKHQISYFVHYLATRQL